MKVIIAGSRGLGYASLYLALIDRPADWTFSEVVSGGARGMDRAGEAWAKQAGIPVRKFYPDWQRFGTSAGFRRNCEMAQYADALLAVWDGTSRGTAHMVRVMRDLNKPVFVWTFQGIRKIQGAKL